MTSPSPMADMIRQLMEMSSMRHSHAAIPWPANPFPKGMRAGSGTQCVWVALLEVHPKWIEHYELMERTGCSRGSIAWAIRYLSENGMVRAISSARNPQYFRYQAIKGKK